jgi:WS/DGAT/MGAT family acyltransferase
VEQLSGQDASFLYAEAPNAPLHVGSISIYDQSTIPGGGPLRFTEILSNISRRLHLAKMMRRRVVRVPFDADHPYWIEDKNFDLEYHVRHIALPRPADWRQLYILASRILATPLDLAKPPWEMYYVEGLDHVQGLPEGCFAVISKTHHCAIDGASSVDLAMLLHDLTPEPADVPPPAQPWRGEDEPPPHELMARASASALLQPWRIGEMLARSLPTLLPRPAAAAPAPARPTAVPRTRFNRTIQAHRAIGLRRYALDDVRKIRKRVVGATVNDVAVALCGGALRHYLLAKQELPAEPLVAMAPISVRTEAEKETMGNRVAGMLISTGSHIADPAERLAHVHESARQSKAMTQAIGARQMTDAMQFIPGALAVMAARFAAENGLANLQNPAYNVTITNVPGPQVPLYSMGARLVTMLGYGPLTHGVGLMFPVTSYAGQFNVSFTACREMLPDPDRLEASIDESYKELRALA